VDPKHNTCSIKQQNGVKTTNLAKWLNMAHSHVGLCTHVD